MKRRIEKAVVLGAGTMGARIAAHFANAGLPCVLLDIVPPGLPPGAPASERNRIVRAGLESARKSRPAAFFVPSLADSVAIGNFEDDLARCAEADWIIEVVAENLEIKRKLLARVAQHRKPGAIITTNTSGLPIRLIADGLPKSATFRTADSVGLDVLVHVVKNIYENAPSDESREAYRVPPLVEEMVRRGMLGEKTGQGFYERVKKDGDSEILTLDVNTFEYRPRQKARFASLEMGKTIEDTRERLRALVGPVLAGQPADKAQKFIWSGLSEMCLYAARRIPEISDSVADVDRAMRWGFAWELGPFELIDAIGVRP